MTVRPTRDAIINADVTNAQQKVNLGNLTDFVGDLLGDDSSSKTLAINTLGALARDMASITAIADGTANEMTVTFDPPFAELVDQLTIYVRASGVNTVSNPTLRVGDFDALPIKKAGGVDVDAGDISGQVCQLHYRGSGPHWELLNPIAITPAKLASALAALDFLALTDFTGDNQLLQGNGYQKLPGGLILQWGIKDASGDAGTFTVTFPVPFFDASIHVSITGNNWSSSGYGQTGLNSVTATGFTFTRGSNQNTIGSHWFALGRYE